MTSMLAMAIGAAALIFAPAPQAALRLSAPAHALRLQPPVLADQPDANPFGGLFGGIAKGLASALEAALDGAFPGQLQLIEEAQRALRADERAVALLGADALIGEVDARESMSVSAGVQLQCLCSGSGGSGMVTIGGARNDDVGPDGTEAGGLTLQLLRLKVDEEDFYVLEP